MTKPQLIELGYLCRNVQDTIENIVDGFIKDNTLEKRKESFINKLGQFLPLYDRSMLNDFYQYWSEHSEGSKKMRFEKETSFDISKRLIRWKKNSYARTTKSQSVSNLKQAAKSILDGVQGGDD